MQASVDFSFSDQVEWLKQIKLTSLSNRALTISSRLAHIIRRTNGVVVQLQSDEMAVELAEQVVLIDDEKLHRLFRSFLEEALRVDDRDHPTPKENKKKFSIAT